MTTERPPEVSLARWLALNRTVGVVLLTVLFVGLGEQLWEGFMPVFLRSQTRQLLRAGETGAEVLWPVLLTVGVYGCLRNLFEGVCYIGGGHLTGRLGDRGSLLLFGALTVAGYLLFLASRQPAVTIVAALLIMGWEPLAVPVTFTTVGSTVEKSRQGMAFAVQSIQKRLPKIIGPLVAGFVLGMAERSAPDPDAGRLLGMRWLVAGALALALGSLAMQVWWMPRRKGNPHAASARQVLREFPPLLRRLWLADVLTRWCDWLVRDFVVLYLVLERRVSLEETGVLFAVQHTTALLTYLPVGRLTQKAGLQPFIGLTFVFFALFPLVLAVVPGGPWLYLAFVVYGLREIGEPARKALITASFPEAIRARGVGLYWGLRGFAICTAAVVGAALWHWYGPRMLLLTAFCLGCVGAVVYYRFCRR